MMKYSVAIFDMDGTILDTLEDLYLSLNYGLKELGMPPRTHQEVRRFLGNGARELIKCVAPDGTSPELLDKLYELFSTHYEEHCSDYTAPYAGIIELVKELKEKGIHTAVVSNKDDEAVQILCQQYFPGCFEFGVGKRDDIPLKPAPDVVLRLLENLGVAKSKAVYIGDTEVDVETAANAGIDCIAVTWGFRDPDFLEECGAKCLAGNARELRERLLGEH